MLTDSHLTTSTTAERGCPQTIDVDVAQLDFRFVKHHADLIALWLETNTPTPKQREVLGVLHDKIEATLGASWSVDANPHLR